VSRGFAQLALVAQCGSAASRPLHYLRRSEGFRALVAQAFLPVFRLKTNTGTNACATTAEVPA